LQLGKLRQNTFKDTRDVVGQIGIPKSKHGHPAIRQPLIPLFVSLRTIGFGMLSAIEFDGEALRRTIKIQNKGTGGMLATEINTELPVSKFLPQTHLNVGRAAPQLAGSNCFPSGQIES
jgi:hypothetical protein